ncbi:FAD-dependent oxidoreductase [Nocardioides luteus]|uniref:FAD-dependent oxidoreductase n=1 Tax=Nocardioides luteus TaxID=1844 RepID=UPI0018CA8907|nr:FAD-dependent oxidoreductase [Nocardioides luteus]MBG6096226.1 succinate dehydrogenase/fumarate reductase flavoprotein subunit [Nocardioides luteus]
MDLSPDLLVIGGGMAGLTAAARASRDGQRVTVVEVSSDVGGSGRFAGYIWTAPTDAVMDEQNPGGDEALKRTLVERFDAAVDWIRSTGVEAGASQRILSFGQGHGFDTNQYVDTCRRMVTESGGQVLLSTTTEELLVDDGAVAGARLRLPTDEVVEIRARTTVLATGGFQADPEMREKLLGPGAGALPLRSNPNSRGDGLRLATAVGAATGLERAGFYGHLVPSGVPFKDSGDFVDLSLYYSEHALLFNLDNERFVDETLGDHLTTVALSEQPEARGLLIADARVRRDWMVPAYVEGAVSVDKFALASKRGGRTGLAESLEELEYLPEEWGYDGAAIRSAIERFNAEVAAGTTPGRKLDATPLDEPPYYVVETTPAITFPFVGVLIDERARVLAVDGAPIPGLLAAGSDTGGLWNRAYAGGLAAAIVFGLTAARTHLEGS